MYVIEGFSHYMLIEPCYISNGVNRNVLYICFEIKIRVTSPSISSRVCDQTLNKKYHLLQMS